MESYNKVYHHKDERIANDKAPAPPPGKRKKHALLWARRGDGKVNLDLVD